MGGQIPLPRTTYRTTYDLPPPPAACHLKPDTCHLPDRLTFGVEQNDLSEVELLDSRLDLRAVAD